ncbi:MAG: glutamate formimidoyltransferase [Acidobacteriia bacterium]|nr:glutamate formimidoyltransferase [Terriglobia bacterium]
MKKIVECVPNFSEGRRKEVVDALAAALTKYPGVALLDCEMDGAHNRCVISTAGEPKALARGVIEAVGKAAELIDLRQHHGEHPRMGATDVVPFIPISGMTIEDCVQLSLEVGEEIATRYRIPIYLYEQSARIPARQDLAYVRRGEFEGIREEIRTNPERKPDFGPLEVHPSAGTTAVGARFPLVAYNIYLNTPDVKIAQAVARAIRFSSGGLRYVKALGFEIKERHQVQVSMNLTNFEATPIFRVFDMVVREAERYGVSVVSSEIVGLVPQKALNGCADFYLRLENFSPNQILENRLTDALPQEPALTEFVSSVAAPDAVPGGGSVAAHAASLAAALGEMVAGLTQGKKKYQAVEARVRDIHQQLTEARDALHRLVQEDAEAYRRVMTALKLPKETAEEKAARAEALEQATRTATEVPLRTARRAGEVLGLLVILAEIGNENARSDAAAGAQLACAALKGAQYNVLINLPGLEDRAFADTCRREADDLALRGQEVLQKVDALLTRLH